MGQRLEGTGEDAGFRRRRPNGGKGIGHGADI
jgi:hypothetical protein